MDIVEEPNAISFGGRGNRLDKIVDEVGRHVDARPSVDMWKQRGDRFRARAKGNRLLGKGGYLDHHAFQVGRATSTKHLYRAFPQELLDDHRLRCVAKYVRNFKQIVHAECRFGWWHRSCWYPLACMMAFRERAEGGTDAPQFRDVRATCVRAGRRNEGTMMQVPNAGRHRKRYTHAADEGHAMTTAPTWFHPLTAQAPDPSTGDGS